MPGHGARTLAAADLGGVEPAPPELLVHRHVPRHPGDALIGGCTPLRESSPVELGRTPKGQGRYRRRLETDVRDAEQRENLGISVPSEKVFSV